MSFWTIDYSPKKYCFGVKLSSTGRAKASIYISSVNISQGLQKIRKWIKMDTFFNQNTKKVTYCNGSDRFLLALAQISISSPMVHIWLLNNKFHGLSPSVGHLTFVWPGVPKQRVTTVPSSRSENHLTVFCIDEIVPGYVVVQLNTTL